jgi:cytochrome c oxidase assembly factor CtaG
MGVGQITNSGLIKKFIPAAMAINFIFLAALIFLTTPTTSEFLPQTSLVVSYGLAGLKFSSYLFGLMVLTLILHNGILETFSVSKSAFVTPLALTWSLTAFATSFFVLANALSIEFSQAANIQVLLTYGWDVATARAYLFMALIALLIALAHKRAKRSTPLSAGFFALLALTLPAALSHAGGVSTHQWGVLAGSVHGFSISLWIASLGALLIAIDRKSAYINFQKLVNFSFWALIFSGIVSSTIRLNTPIELLSTQYGQLLLLKIFLFIVIISLVSIARKNIEKANHIMLVELMLLMMVLAIATILSSIAYPRVSPAAFTLIESVTGFPQPPPFSTGYALTTFSIQPTIFLVGVIAIYLYLKGVFTLRARGDKWPINRTLLWISGVLLAMYFTNSMMGRYALVMFSAHMVVHMVLAMVVPILLPLAAPITLALRALPASQQPTLSLREGLNLFLSSRFSYVLTYPIVAFLLFATSTWMLYFTPLLSTLMNSHLGHLFMDLHFILVGYVFFWTIIGKDPSPHKISDPARLGLVFLAAVFHGFFGFIVSSSTSPLGGGWFMQVAPDWLADPIADQQLGGSIAWGFGEIPTVVVLIILLFQWAKRDAKIAKRFTQADTDAYNEYLSELNKRG